MIKSLILLGLSTLSSASLAKTYKVVLSKDNTIVLNTAFEATSVAKVAAAAKLMDLSLPPNKPIFLVLDTNGGSVESGIELIEVLNSIDRPIHTVTLFAASMGFQTVQSLNRGQRLITRAGVLMSHKAKGAFKGEFPGQLDSIYNFYLKRITNLNKAVVARTKGKHTLESYNALIENEYWCEGNDCIEQGFIDAIAKVSCDKSLSGIRVESEKFMFMGMPVEVQMLYSNCPLITGLIDTKTLVSGTDIFAPKNSDIIPSITEQYSKEVLEKLSEKVKEVITTRSNNNNKKMVNK
jgi:ATP-dependent protease ClpP protease subunit